MRPAIEQAAQAVPTGAACPPSAATAIDCRSCGACCSYSAEWPRLSLESDAHIARIPRGLVAASGRGMRCTGDRCAALVGVVGEATSCAIYALRPDVCRTCSPGDVECLQARRHFGL
jgi:Fe-S-cluster containining protein